HPAYSFVVPIYNDGYLVESFCKTINDEMKRLLDLSDLSNDVEVIFVNDGSSDESQQQLETTTTKYSFASGNYVGMMKWTCRIPQIRYLFCSKRLNQAPETL